MKIDFIENKRVTLDLVRFIADCFTYSWLTLYRSVYVTAAWMNSNIFNRQRFWSILVGCCVLHEYVNDSVQCCCCWCCYCHWCRCVLFSSCYYCVAAWWYVPYVHIIEEISRLNVSCSSENIKLKKVTGSFHETLRTFWH